MDGGQRHRVAAEADQLLGRQRAPHLDVGRTDSDEAHRHRRLPEVVVEHRDWLVQAPVAVGVRQERVRQVAEVLRVDPVVGVEVGHDHLPRIEPEAVGELAV